MKLYFIQHENGSITTANWPIKENDIESTPFEVSEEQIQEVQDGIKDWVIVNDQLSTVNSDRKAKAEAEKLAQEQAIQDAKTRKFELIKKVTAGTATIEEQEEFANLL